MTKKHDFPPNVTFLFPFLVFHYLLHSYLRTKFGTASLTWCLSMHFLYYLIFDLKVNGSLLVTSLGLRAQPSAQWGLNEQLSDSDVMFWVTKQLWVIDCKSPSTVVVYQLKYLIHLKLAFGPLASFECILDIWHNLVWLLDVWVEMSCLGCCVVWA